MEMQWEYAELLVQAFSATQKKVIRFPAGPAAEAAAAVVKQLTGRVNFRVKDMCSVYPPKKLSARPNLRLFSQDEDIFTFTAGLCMPLRGCVVDEDPPFLRSFDPDAWRMQTAGLAEIARTPGAVAASSIRRVPVYTLTPESNGVFFAGVMTGALLAARNTTFVFSMCTPEEKLGDFLLPFTRAGGMLLPLVDGLRVVGKAQRLRMQKEDAACG